MGHLTGAAAQIRSLAKAVSTAFASTDLTPEDLAPSQIEYTDLPWSVPPLVSRLQLGAASMQDYLDAPMNIQEDKLLRFWRESLDTMWTSPSRIMRAGTHAGLKSAMPHVRAGTRALRFSEPLGFPGRLDPMSGLVFSLEAAHAAYISLPIADLLSNEDNYVVTFHSGARIGVASGRPLAGPWDFDGSGMVQEMLEMPRGATSHLCQYDGIALARSNLYKHRKLFADFDALDLALQTLRYLTFGTHCPELTVQMKAAPEDLAARRRRVSTLEEAIEVASSSINDRAKLQTLRQLLVPDVLAPSAFKRHVFSSPDFPFTMAAGKDQEILTFLRARHETESACKP